MKLYYFLPYHFNQGNQESKFHKFLILTIILIASVLNLQSQTWKRLNPLPQGNNLFKTFFINSDTGFSVGNFGTILKTTDGGKSWLDRSLCDESNFLNDVYFLDQNKGFACGCGVFVKTTDGGNNWDNVLDALGCFMAVGFISSDTGYVFGMNGNFITTDGGDTWKGYDAPWGDELTAVCFEGNSVYVAYYDSFDDERAIIYKKTVGTNYWESYSFPPYQSYKTIDKIQFYDDNNGFLIYSGDLYFTSNAGRNWSRNYLSICDPFYFTGPNTGFKGEWINSSEYGILKTEDGENWNLKYSGTASLTSFEFIDSQLGFAVGWNGEIVKTTDGGETWEACYDDITDKRADFYAGTFTDKLNGTIAGRIIMNTIDGGDTWQKVNDSVNIIALHFLSKETGYAIQNKTLSGEFSISKTNDGGTSWSNIGSIPYIFASWLTDLYFTDSETGFICGGINSSGDRNIFKKSTDGGYTWTDISIDTRQFLRDIYFRNKDTGYLVGDSSALFRTNDGGLTWNLIALDTIVCLESIGFNDDSVGFLCGKGVIYRTNNGGDTWSVIYRDNETEFCSINVSNDTCFVFGHKNLFKPVLMRTVDGGIIWDQVEFCNVSQTSLVWKDNKTLFLVGNGGSLIKVSYESEDGMNDQPKTNSFTFFPNPAIDFIHFSQNIPGGSFIDIVDISGKSVLKYTSVNTDNLIDISKLPRGVYIFHFYNKNQNMTSRFIKM